ncbi:MAG: cystathionine gamma-synthase [Elusimicrobia bacterium]|nr:cystathionine gamma-synthase [Elusimicrobiota bacterium]
MKKFATQAIHAGLEPDPTTGAVMTPVYLTSTYAQEAPGKHKGFDYSRTNHPTRQALERNLAALEEGTYGLAFGSGMAATSTVVLSLSAGDHVVCGKDVYGGTNRVFTQVFQRFGLKFSFVNAHQPAEVRGAILPETKLIWLETPSNPLLHITDISEVVEIAHKKKVQMAVDNTFATPALQNPLTLGADLVVHSTTKYLGGHSDVVGGAIVTKNEEWYQKLKFLQNAVGAIPGPLDCFLVLRGIKTLAVRMEKHCGNAQRIAEFLSHHSEVEKVYYPGLPSHPAHIVAKRQMRGFGGMLSFELKGHVDRALNMASSTKVFTLAESLGGVESLIGHPASMTHGSIPKEEREKAGLKDTLLRLSVGIEDVEDLIQDLDQAIKQSAKS